MKSLRSIAQQKNLNFNKLEQVANELTELSPVKMGSTLFYTSDDAQAILYAFYSKYPLGD